MSYNIVLPSEVSYKQIPSGESSDGGVCVRMDEVVALLLSAGTFDFVNEVGVWIGQSNIRVGVMKISSGLVVCCTCQ